MAVPAQAFELVIKETIVITGDPTVFHIDGQITKNTWERFSTRMKVNIPLKTVVLNSQGGYTYYAKLIAKIIRLNRMTTKIEEKKICMSACVLIFQSGVRRIADVEAVFMLHPTTITIKKVRVPDKNGTNVFYGLLMHYGMKRWALREVRKNGDTYFNARSAEIFGIATEVDERAQKTKLLTID